MTAHIGIVDDHPAVTLGLTAMINAHPSLHVVAATSSVNDLLQTPLPLDVVLLDLVLADGSTPSNNVRQLVARRIPVLIYTSGDQPRLIREAARAGAVGMIRKSEPPAPIVRAIGAVLQGEPVASADWAHALSSDTEFVSAALSERESEVLALYASGETAERVAAELFISRETVLDHIRRIRAKYAAVERAAPTKVDLFRRAVEDGLLPPGSG